MHRALRRPSSPVGAIAAVAGIAAFVWVLQPVLHPPLGNLLPVPLLAGAALAGAVWPAAALTVLAALIPVAGPLGLYVFPAAWAELIALATLGGFWAGAAWRGRPHVDRALLAPSIAAAAVVLASLVSQGLVEERTIGAVAFADMYLHGARQDFFVARQVYASLDAAVRLLESLALFVTAAAVTRLEPKRLAPLAGAVAIGGAGAALLTLHRLWTGAQRLESPLATFVHYLATIRLNVPYGDLNAAGSHFLLVIGCAAGLVLCRRSRWWLAVLALGGAGLWMSGSRTAMAAAVIVAGGAILVRRRRAGRLPVRQVVMAAGLIAVLVLTVAVLLPERGNQQNSPTALRVRAGLAGASARMLAAAPLFGVGVGQYSKRSGEFASAELLRLFPPARSENAHNNYLQVLAELGMVGFAVFAWLLIAAGRRAVATVTHDRGPLAWSVAAGLLAFALSCLAGHPLLITEPAFTCWLLAGALAGAAPAEAAAVAAGSGRRRWSAAAAVTVAALATVPARANRQVSGLDLEHVGIGVSVWEVAPDGTRYRTGGARSTIFLPADAAGLTIPLRSVAPPARRVFLQLNGRPADVVIVPADGWLPLRLQMPNRPDQPRFHRLDLTVEGASPEDGPLLMIGKVQAP